VNLFASPDSIKSLIIVSFHLSVIRTNGKPTKYSKNHVVKLAIPNNIQDIFQWDASS
jgi:hypothetical protein